MQSLNRFKSENKIQLHGNPKRDITEHSKQLQLKFKENFLSKPTLSLFENGKLIDLSSKNSVKAVFADHSGSVYKMKILFEQTRTSKF